MQFAAAVEQWRPLVSAYFPSDAVDNMLAIMTKESSGNPTAHYFGTAANPEHSWGLFQINIDAWGGTPDQWSDPENNVRQARVIYDVQGYGAWYNSAQQLGLLGGGGGGGSAAGNGAGGDPVVSAPSATTVWAPLLVSLGVLFLVLGSR